MKMKMSTILQAITAISLAVIIAVAAVAPTLASMPYVPQVVTNGNFGSVTLLQFPSNATPPAQLGTPNHPTCLMLDVYDGNSMATFAGADRLTVFLWNPVRQRFTPVVIITDNAELAEFMKMLWNMTYAWYPTSPTFNLYPNVIQVAPTEIEVWTSNDALFVNLTKPVTVTLPGFLTAADATYTNQTFILPPLTLEFRATGDAFKDTIDVAFTDYSGASNYTMKGYPMTQPAWVRTRIAEWCESPLEFIGHKSTGAIYFVPPQ